MYQITKFISFIVDVSIN